MTQGSGNHFSFSERTTPIDPAELAAIYAKTARRWAENCEYHLDRARLAFYDWRREYQQAETCADFSLLFARRSAEEAAKA